MSSIKEKLLSRDQNGSQDKPLVYVALSGGVDSSVAAALLIKSGNFRVVGAHMVCWRENTKHSVFSILGCTAEQDAEDARRVADELDIPFYVFDLEKEYRKRVFDYMIREYASGLTPNPDVMCNKEIKFGVFLDKALSLGADYVATGHYVRREPEFPISPSISSGSRADWRDNSQFPNKEKFENSEIENVMKIGNWKLKIAKDTNKDQSYFLWTLTQEQLQHSLFPIGEYTKPEVRVMAEEFGLPTYAKKDSQGLCFVGNIDFELFMKEQLPTHAGKIVTTKGKEIGAHEGAEFYTIGQRRGIKIGGGVPYYVTKKNVKTNTVVVAEGPYDDALFKNELVVRDAHWISNNAPQVPFECEVRIRYRQPLQKARIIIHVSHNIKQEILIRDMCYVVRFIEPQRAVTPGQSVVFYAPAEASAKEDKDSPFGDAQGKEMLGGGIIE